MTDPDETRRAKERSYLLVNLADTGITSVILSVALATGSLTLLGEAMRCVLLIGVSFCTYFIMVGIHRNRLRRYAYGVAKFEQFAWLLIGVSMIVSAAWLSFEIVTRFISSAGGEPSPLGLSAAAVVNAFNLLINYLGWYAMDRAADGDRSGVFGAEMHARWAQVLCSIFLQCTLTAAALAQDPALAIGFDVIGAIFVVGLMLVTATGMATAALPDLIDRRAPNEIRAAIVDAATAVLPADSVCAIRTRRAAREIFVEVEVSPNGVPTMAALHRVEDAIMEKIADGSYHVRVTVVVRDGQTGELPATSKATVTPSHAAGADG